MRIKTALVSALVVVGLLLACGEAPTGEDPFGPEFEIIPDPGDPDNTFKYTFNDLSGADLFCQTGVTSDGVYEDLLFVDWDAVGSCFFSALFLRDGGAFSIQFLPAAKKASKVSVTEPFGTGTLTLVVSSESSTCPAPVSGSGVTLTATCAGITSIGLSGTSETLLDNLTITYEPIFDPPTECSTKGKKPHKAWSEPPRVDSGGWLD